MNKKMSVHAWINFSGISEKKIEVLIRGYKLNGIDRIMCSAGTDPSVYKSIGKIAKKVGLEFHAWIPTLIQQNNKIIKPEWYAVNGLGESSYHKPVYVSHYQFLCPNKKELQSFLFQLYESISILEEVDGIHLDYIRFPDVILPRGLWKKYALEMYKELPAFDYCYCAKCVNDFKKKSSIAITSYENPSLITDWKQFRYDLISDLVNQLSKLVRSKNKQISAAVFPGPEIAKKLVRQDWANWEVDALYSMNYNDFYLKKPTWIGQMCKNAVGAVQNGKPIYSGLFICPTPVIKELETDPEHHGLLPKELEIAIKQSVENNASGICLYTPNRMTQAHWKVLRNNI